MWEYMLGSLKGLINKGWKLRMEGLSNIHVWVSHAVGTPQVPPPWGPRPGQKTRAETQNRHADGIHGGVETTKGETLDM